MNFVDVEGYEEYFMISDCGNVFSKRTNKILKLNKIGKGYLAFSTKINGKDICFRVHRLVAKAFIPNVDNKPEVNHKDGDKTNNNFSNLEWVTGKENIIHSIKTGLKIHHKGVANPRSALDSEQVKFIRENAKQCGGSYTQKELGMLFGVNYTTIGKCIREKEYCP